MDLISLNTTTNLGLNIYAQSSSVNPFTVPKLTIYNDTTPTLLNTSLNISSGGANSAILSTSASGLTVDDNITATGSLTSTTGVVNLVGSSFSSGGGAVNVNSSSFGIINTSLGNIGVALSCPVVGVLQVGGGLNCSQLTLANGANTSVLTTTASGLNVADPLTATSLTLSSGAYSSVITTTSSGLNVADAITSTGIIYGQGLNANNNSLVVGGISALAQQSNANVGGDTITAAGLYLARNAQVGQNEFDIIAINKQSGATSMLNIYTEPSQFVGGTSQPLLRLTDTQAYLNGSAIATSASTNLTFASYSFSNGSPVFNYSVNTISGTNTLNLYTTTSQNFQGPNTTVSLNVGFPVNIFPTGATNITFVSGNATFYSANTNSAVGCSVNVLSNSSINFTSGASLSNSLYYYIGINVAFSWAN